MKRIVKQTAWIAAVLLSLVIGPSALTAADAVKTNTENDVTHGFISVVHAVESGDTFFGIARAYYLSADYEPLTAYNGLDAKKGLKAGAELIVPNPLILDRYTVKTGDTLYSITNRYFNRSTFLKYVMEWNGIVHPDKEVQAGMELQVPLPIGNRTHQVLNGETLYSITAKYFKQQDFLHELAEWNEIDESSYRLEAGQLLQIPNPFYTDQDDGLFKKASTDISIEVDLSKNKLSVVANGTVLRTFDIASGKKKDLTPTGRFTIIAKLVEPWYVAKDIPGGDPNNPLGSRWMGLDVPGTHGTKYGIHGTNDESSIGNYVSSGCIRMRNEDVEWLYERIPKGTEVTIK